MKKRVLDEVKSHPTVLEIQRLLPPDLVKAQAQMDYFYIRVMQKRIDDIDNEDVQKFEEFIKKKDIPVEIAFFVGAIYQGIEVANHAKAISMKDIINFRYECVIRSYSKTDYTHMPKIDELREELLNLFK